MTSKQEHTAFDTIQLKYLHEETSLNIRSNNYYIQLNVRIEHICLVLFMSLSKPYQTLS